MGQRLEREKLGIVVSVLAVFSFVIFHSVFVSSISFKRTDLWGLKTQRTLWCAAFQRIHLSFNKLSGCVAVFDHQCERCLWVHLRNKMLYVVILDHQCSINFLLILNSQQVRHLKPEWHKDNVFLPMLPFPDPSLCLCYALWGSIFSRFLSCP